MNNKQRDTLHASHFTLHEMRAQKLLFMQNKAKFKKDNMYASTVLTKNYNEKLTMEGFAKRTQNKPNFKRAPRLSTGIEKPLVLPATTMVCESLVRSFQDYFLFLKSSNSRRPESFRNSSALFRRPWANINSYPLRNSLIASSNRPCILRATAKLA